ncbi:MAG: putative xanthine dehydrogenase molybdenum-binding subunit XdhA [Verrucomicrobia subdivision 3 bacterium]|nr:putative xanthine dehydrogenase molybdenum-binding subunit XdhA [Limisphaerales bacterium]MCS1415259.1 putative xanthine dehydrogenase molybdenum-binding subunit XdhA [Limisphaerales bacterium]
MAKVAWPAENDRKIIGSRISRADGPVKATGAAKYSYDINRPGMLWAKLVTSPKAHAKLISVNTSIASALPGVQAVWVDNDMIGEELRYVGQVIGAVAAETEEAASEGAEKVELLLKVLEHQVDDKDPSLTIGRPSNRENGNLDEGFASADVIVEGNYGIPVITHCCLEPHGQVTEVKDGELYVWPSTQNVSRYSNQFGDEIEIPQNKIHVETQYMGGGFGSKFNIDKWGIIGAKLSQETGRPVKIMLDRREELMIGGNRPSGFAKVKVGLRQDGTITAVDAEVWGSGGQGAFRPPPVPYVFTKVPNTRLVGRGIRTNRGGIRAWRAPNHPQGCLITMSVLDDAAAALGMDSLEFFMRNAALTDRPETYREELQIAANMIGYRQKAHARGDSGSGPVKRGLGIAIHTWGGRGHPSECDVTIHSDGSVESKIGSQDLGTGTRTCIGMVIAETLGLPYEAITVHLGRNAYPPSGASGGSTTIGGISVSARRAATDALNDLLATVAGHLGTAADSLEASGGRIHHTDKLGGGVSWREACSMLGPNSITKRGINNPGESQQEGLISAGVGGVQIADVSVDVETGVVTMNEMVAVQDCGLIVNMKLAESQFYGSLIMGITYALYEESIYDLRTGIMLNPDMEFYRLAGIKDVGNLKVHMMTGQGYDDRGIIGLGEPPVISPGAAISNAVANACGVRVPNLPLTPEKVLAALQKGGDIA